MKKIQVTENGVNQIHFDCDCGFKTTNQPETAEGNAKIEDELAQHMMKSKKCKKQLKKYYDEYVTKVNLGGGFLHPVH